jgi:hypothetical protein
MENRRVAGEHEEIACPAEPTDTLIAAKNMPPRPALNAGLIIGNPPNGPNRIFQWKSEELTAFIDSARSKIFVNCAFCISRIHHMPPICDNILLGHAGSSRELLGADGRGSFRKTNLEVIIPQRWVV